MPELQKLEWLPLYVDNLLSSPAWLDMKDFQKGWYIQLLLRSTRSEHLGHLPLDGQLWRLAGAHSRDFFEREKSAVMACFKIRQFDGQDWIYNQKLLSVMEDQSAKYRRRGPPLPSYSPAVSEVDSGKSTSKAEAVPSGLHPLQYAASLLQELSLPSRGNLEVVADAVKACAHWKKCDLSEAHDYLLGTAQASDEPINRWWFQDCKWKPENTRAVQDMARRGLDRETRNVREANVGVWRPS